MRPAAARLLAAAAVAGLACSTPTSVCGCSPALPPGVAVVGTLTTAGGAPVAGARVAVDGIPAGWRVDTLRPSYLPLETDAAGAFRGTADARLTGTVTARVRVTVARAGVADTVVLDAGLATFRSMSPPPDTVRVVLRLP